ncbi:fumarylacetoacetate hydrolase family protein [Thermomonospora umbrina]|uniref:2-keto-4-pentenoate hydratase/2-oxohepta-3-ene-1,7-dioic acid hydratase in catechol pathway n=1 Tax=Thermomonospora umbrina TaxID=111806 RepID=A0A3D9SYT6_9ACTN|nr:fumarylacetoacetate hydrolase family protein [Thermomonospora umbrina]REE97734.1 2-keto-4-pentenoate hydratase/2-oxohepta-3-ene-1,7-dioic acid hydratase in catechol pathway [Thermomonospora umbrina]
MFLCRFEAGEGVRLGARLDDERLVDLCPALVDLTGPSFDDPVIEFIQAGPAALDMAVDQIKDPPPDLVRPLADVRLLAPVEPPKMRNFSVYEGHVRNAVSAAIELRAGRAAAGLARLIKVAGPPRAWYRRPLYYKGNPTSVIGPDTDIVRPSYTRRLDYELELAVVVGTSGRDLTVENAHEHVFGYTILNDVSARDVLAGELLSRMGPAKGKDFDTGNVLGPWLATRDEIPDPRALTGEVRVNGRHRARCTTADMRYTIEQMLVEASRGETLVPGEVIGTGCCTWGSGLELKRFLQPGDVVELTLGPLGTLRNRVTA